MTSLKKIKAFTCHHSPFLFGSAIVWFISKKIKKGDKGYMCINKN